MDGTGWHGAQYKHYPTMTFAQIEALPVRDVVADNAILFLWAVNPLLPKCLKVVDAWGFDYRGMITWAKTVGDVPRLEMFSREQRPGWTSWGNE